jgi:putative endonuclease
MYYCYILQCADDSYYVGVAESPERRCAEHNARKGADWTAARLPVTLLWQELHPSLASARAREIQLTGWSRKKKEALVTGSLRLTSSER